MEPKPQSWVLTPPNWQLRSQKDVDTTKTIQVPEGFTIRFAWTNFDTGPSDYVQIVDGDGTELTPRLTMRYEIGRRKLPPPGLSNTNTMHIEFHTSKWGWRRQRGGWRLEWGKYKVICIAYLHQCK